MKSAITLSMLTLAAFGVGMTSLESPAAAGHHTGRNIAIGIGAAAATAIILNEAARADERRRYRRYSCDDLYMMCEEGRSWACRKYEARCE